MERRALQQRNIRASISEEQRQTERKRERERQRRRRVEMSATKKRERDRERERTNGRKREGQGERKGEEEKREQLATSSGRIYLGPMTFCQHCQALIFPIESLNCCHNGKVSLPPLGEYPSPLKDLFTGSNTTESRTTSGSTTVPSPLL